MHLFELVLIKSIDGYKILRVDKTNFTVTEYVIVEKTYYYNKDKWPEGECPEPLDYREPIAKKTREITNIFEFLDEGDEVYSVNPVDEKDIDNSIVKGCGAMCFVNPMEYETLSFDAIISEAKFENTTMIKYKENSVEFGFIYERVDEVDNVEPMISYMSNNLFNHTLVYKGFKRFELCTLSSNIVIKGKRVDNKIQILKKLYPWIPLRYFIRDVSFESCYLEVRKEWYLKPYDMIFNGTNKEIFDSSLEGMRMSQVEKILYERRVKGITSQVMISDQEAFNMRHSWRNKVVPMYNPHAEQIMRNQIKYEDFDFDDGYDSDEYDYVD